MSLWAGLGSVSQSASTNGLRGGSGTGALGEKVYGYDVFFGLLSVVQGPTELHI